MHVLMRDDGLEVMNLGIRLWGGDSCKLWTTASNDATKGACWAEKEWAFRRRRRGALLDNTVLDEDERLMAIPGVMRKRPS